MEIAFFLYPLPFNHNDVEEMDSLHDSVDQVWPCRVTSDTSFFVSANLEACPRSGVMPAERRSTALAVR
jgi:hypothetical protein